MLKRVLLLLSFYLVSINLLAKEVVNHGGAISETTTWTNDKIHVVTSDLSINVGIKLTIEPGTVVKFDASKRLTVRGALNAVGTAELPIYFTSYRDDAVGGDSNDNGFSEGVTGD
ncbi:MAG: hypothetical protein GY928_18380, partial [Colwellia sp.]|nr:hypothetical protein [Colwellia sp.]